MSSKDFNPNIQTATPLFTRTRTVSLLAIIFITFSVIGGYAAGVNGVMLGLGAALWMATFVIWASRTVDIRIATVELDERAMHFISEAISGSSKQNVSGEPVGEVRLIAHRPGRQSLPSKQAEIHAKHGMSGLDAVQDCIFLEVTQDGSVSHDKLKVHGVTASGFKVLQCKSPAVPNAIGALLLKIRDETGKTPHVYLGWTDGHPLTYVVKYVLFGEGETAPITREILRRREPDPEKRPIVHVS